MGTIEGEAGIMEKLLERLSEEALRLSFRVVLAAVALLIGVQLIKLTRRLLQKALKRSKAEENALRFIDSLVKYGLYFVLVLSIASGLGVDAASILAILGSASVALGLAVQGSLSNLAGGVLLLVLKPFSAGDYIRDSQGNEGTVEAVDVFYTQLVTPDNRIIVLPNGALANGSITNYTRCSSRRIDIAVGIAYDADIGRARQVLTELLSRDSGVLKEKEQVVFVDALGESSINLMVRCWAGKDEYWQTKWRLTEQVRYALEEAGIKIPYPQVDVHLCHESQGNKS